MTFNRLNATLNSKNNSPTDLQTQIRYSIQWYGCSRFPLKNAKWCRREMNDGNNNLAANARVRGLQHFYAGGCALVTGGTGFVGKALVEKLLRGCPDLCTVFILIRSKRGQNPEARYRELLKSSVSQDMSIPMCIVH